MEHPSGTAPDPTEHLATSGTERLAGLTDGSARAKPSPTPTRATTSQAPELLFLRDKDAVTNSELLRRDTDGSLASNFALQRSNTDWSVAASTATDLTDLNSPDTVFADEGVDSGAETCASSPRRSGFYHPLASQKRLPIRAPSNPNDHRPPASNSPSDGLTPRHRRLEQIGSRKSSLSRYKVPDTVPGPSSSLSQEPSHSEAAESPVVEAFSHQTEHEGAKTPDVHDQEGNNFAHRTGSIFRPRNSQSYASADQPNTVQVDRKDVDADNALASGESTPDGNVPVTVEASEGTTTPEERPISRRSEASDLCDDDIGVPYSGPDDSIVHQVCDLILQQAFGIRLEDVAVAGSASIAYESVGYCLDELSRIVSNSGFSNAHLGTSGPTWLGPDSRNNPIRPARGAGGGSGDGQGNGDGGRKRPGGAHDGNGVGGGPSDGSPNGSGKRQKVTTYQLSTDMHLSCPFRKRNPLRFNVRDSQACAVMAWQNISLLKQAMGSREALEAHASVGKDQICDPRTVPSSADPEEGITSGIEDILNDRKAGTKIDDWTSLWRLLFPGDIEVPDSDFVPPTELEEVYAQFNSDDSRRQLRERIREVLGRAGDAESMFDTFNSHVNSVFEVCRNKTGGVSNGRRRLRIQASQPAISRRSPAQLTPCRQSSGRSDISISTPVAGPNTTSIFGSLGFPFMTEPQPHLDYATPVNSPANFGFNGARPTMGLPSDSGATAAYGNQPVTVPPPAPQVHMNFSLSQNRVGMLDGHCLAPPPRLTPADSGLDLSSLFAGQRAPDYSPVLSLGSQDAYSGLRYSQHMPDESSRALTPGECEVQAQEFSLIDAGTVLGASDCFLGTYMPDAEDDGFEVVHRNDD
ncbi:hypothetical protein P885DRAFT_79048 [Corynascus similis CBS 632.67]